MRTARVVSDGAKYQVVASINRQEMIFKKKVNRELLRKYIERAKSKYSFEVDKVSIQGYQLNMTINPADKVELARIMKSILGGFAVKYNYMNGVKGHVWYGRFESQPCE